MWKNIVNAEDINDAGKSSRHDKRYGDALTTSSSATDTLIESPTTHGGKEGALELNRITISGDTFIKYVNLDNKEVTEVVTEKWVW